MTTRKPASTATTPASTTVAYAGIHDGIAELLQGARQAAASNINALMTATYWEIGRRIVEAEQQGKRRAGYGDVLIKHLASDLTAQFGRGLPLAQSVPDARLLPRAAGHIADSVCRFG